MPNTLNNLIPDLYAALNVVSRELVGFIPSVTRDTSVERAALNQPVHVPLSQPQAATDITPGQLPPDDGDQTFDSKSITITKARRVPFRWNGEQSRGIDTGPGVLSLQQQQIAQALRTLTNEIEADLSLAHAKASRAHGTAGSTPFATAGNFTDATKTLQILKDNGAPNGDNQLVLSTNSGAELLGKQSRADFQDNDSMLRQGVLIDHMGMSIRESAETKTFVKGDASGATTDNAGYAVGATVITITGTSGAIKDGDVITFAGDTNQYVVATGNADVSGGGTITLSKPGLRQAIPSSTTAITVIGDSERNVAFSRSAIILAQRLPEMPAGGDSAEDITTIADPRSGLVFEVVQYGEYRRRQWEIAATWGYEVIKPEHTALLLG